MEPETKKRKFIRPPPRRNSIAPSPSPAAGNKDPAFVLTTTTTTTTKPMVNVDQSGVGVDPRIQHAKNHAISQAQQDASKANFKIFDSPFANFLLPVIPTRAELGASSVTHS